MWEAIAEIFGVIGIIVTWWLKRNSEQNRMKDELRKQALEANTEERITALFARLGRRLRE